jgi:hypothetical protein
MAQMAVLVVLVSPIQLAVHLFIMQAVVVAQLSLLGLAVLVVLAAAVLAQPLAAVVHLELLTQVAAVAVVLKMQTATLVRAGQALLD